MKDSILILGAGFMQRPAIQAAKELGLFVIVADGNALASERSLADLFEHIDLKDTDAMLKAAAYHKANNSLKAVFTAGTDFSATVAYVSENLSLPGISYESALNASIKTRMRKVFSEHKVPSPAWIEASKFENTIEFSRKYGFPLVVKPVDNMGARGVRRVDTIAELEEALIQALYYSRTKTAIVEEYLDGDEFSLDALVHNGEITICGFADRHIYYPPYFIEMGHTMPTIQSDAVKAEVIRVFSLGIKALGITNGAAKGDMKYTKKGAMVGEIAARLSGGYMSGWTFPYASGVELTKNAIRIALGQGPESLNPLKDSVCAERALISIPGVIKTIGGVHKAENLDGVKHVFMRVKEGDTVVFPKNNVEKCGNIIALAQDRKSALAQAEKALKAITLRLEVPNKVSEAFLKGEDVVKNTDGSVYPPPAFVLSKEIKEALDEMPAFYKETSGLDNPSVCIAPFPELFESKLTDYHKKTVQEAFLQVTELTGLKIAEDADIMYGSRFWKSFVMGSYQGGTYIIDKDDL